MASSRTETTREAEELKQFLRRLRPGDRLKYKTNKQDETSATVTKTTIEDGLYRVYAKGPRDGEYVFMPEKAEGMGHHPVPEVFWVNPDPDEGSNTYELITRGALLSISLTVEREL